MRSPWSWGESDEVLPDLRVLRAQLDAVLIEVQRYNDQVQRVAEQSPPVPGVRREVHGE